MNVIGTVDIGMGGISELTRAALVRYAERHGAELVIKTETSHVLPHFAKYELFTEVLDQYDPESFLYIDTDVYIREGSPSIFQWLRGTNAAWNEVPHPNTGLLDAAFKWLDDNSGQPWDRRYYFNTGVILLQNDALIDLSRVLEQTVPIRGRYFEQDQLNMLMHQLPSKIHPMSRKWNQLCGKWHYHKKRMRDGFFLHAAGLSITPEGKIEPFTEIIKEFP